MNQAVYKSAMRFGAYSGLCSFVFFILIYVLNSNPLGNSAWFASWIPIVFIVVGTKSYRNDDLEGYIKYWQAVGAGFLIAVFAGLIYAVLGFVFGTLIDPSILENYKVEAISKVEEARQYLSNEKFLSALDEAHTKIEEMTLTQIAQSVFFNNVLGGFLVSLIVAAIFKKEKPMFDDTIPSA